MRNHVQGLGLLIVLAAAVWGTARLAAPAVDEAFGGDDDDTETTEPSEDVVDLSVADDELTAEELYGLQWYLTIEGYDTGGLDGLLGPSTTAAVSQALEDYGLPVSTSHRGLFDFLVTRQSDPGPDPTDPTLPALAPATAPLDDADLG